MCVYRKLLLQADSPKEPRYISNENLKLKNSAPRTPKSHLSAEQTSGQTHQASGLPANLLGNQASTGGQQEKPSCPVLILIDVSASNKPRFRIAPQRAVAPPASNGMA